MTLRSFSALTVTVERSFLRWMQRSEILAICVSRGYRAGGPVEPVDDFAVFCLAEDPAGDDEVAVEPGVPEAASVGLDVAQVVVLRGVLALRREAQTGRVRVRADYLEVGLLRVEVLAHRERDQA